MKPVVGLLVFIVATIGIISAPTNAIGAQQEKFQEEVAANKSSRANEKVQNSQENAEDTQSSDTETTTNSTTERVKL